MKHKIEYLEKCDRERVHKSDNRPKVSVKSNDFLFSLLLIGCGIALLLQIIIKVIFSIIYHDTFSTIFLYTCKYFFITMIIFIISCEIITFARLPIEDKAGICVITKRRKILAIISLIITLTNTATNIYINVLSPDAKYLNEQLNNLSKESILIETVHDDYTETEINNSLQIVQMLSNNTKIAWLEAVILTDDIIIVSRILENNEYSSPYILDEYNGKSEYIADSIKNINTASQAMFNAAEAIVSMNAINNNNNNQHIEEQLLKYDKACETLKTLQETLRNSKDIKNYISYLNTCISCISFMYLILFAIKSITYKSCINKLNKKGIIP